MASTIGEGAYGEPTHIPIPNSQFSGSTSGIGGQSTETVSKYDSTYGFMRRYTPGSKMFTKLGRGLYNGPVGNWGHRTFQKINLVKQVGGVAGILSANPLARIKNTKFIALNYGRQHVDPQLPRGGSVPRVIDTTNVENPKAFYSDYNWGSGVQQRHEQPLYNPYHTIPPEGPRERTDPADEGVTENHGNLNAQTLEAYNERQQHQHFLNPMTGRAGTGFTTMGAYQDLLDMINNTEDGVEDLLNYLDNHLTTDTNDFTARRASNITHAFDVEAARRLFQRANVSASGGVGTEAVAEGAGGLGGIETTRDALGEESLEEYIARQKIVKALKGRGKQKAKDKGKPMDVDPKPENRRRRNSEGSGVPRNQRPAPALSNGLKAAPKVVVKKRYCFKITIEFLTNDKEYFRVDGHGLINKFPFSKNDL